MKNFWKNNKKLLKWIIVILTFIACVLITIYSDNKDAAYCFVLWAFLVGLLTIDFSDDSAHGGYA